MHYLKEILCNTCRIAGKWTKTEIGDVIMCVHELVSVWTRWFSAVCLHSKWSLQRRILACYYTTYQQTCVKRSEVVIAEINSAESFCSTGQFLAHDSSSYTFVIAKVSTQRRTRPFLHKLASSLCRSVLFLQFACGAWPSTDRNVVRASRIRSANIKTAKRVCRHFSKFCTFPAILAWKLQYKWCEGATEAWCLATTVCKPKQHQARSRR